MTPTRSPALALALMVLGTCAFAGCAGKVAPRDTPTTEAPADGASTSSAATDTGGRSTTSVASSGAGPSGTGGVGASSAAACGRVGFEPMAVYAVGDDPRSLVAADFNGDGRLDLVAVNQGGPEVPPMPGSLGGNRSPNSVSVLLNQGSGVLAPQVNYPVGMQPIWLATGDFNGDGKPDLATANLTDSTVSVLLNQALGTFATPAAYPAPGAIVVATGDFDGDGQLDLAVTGGEVSVLLNGGGGAFGAARVANDASLNFLVAADLNGDGKPDLVGADPTGHTTVTVVINQGSATFAPGVAYTVRSEPHGIAVGDFNGDGQLDIATSDARAGVVSVLMNAGHGVFAAAASYAVGNFPEVIATGDFDGDGKLDIGVVVNPLSPSDAPQLSVLLNDGAGTFGPATTFTAGAPSSVPMALVSADFNGDGRPDVAVADWTNGLVSVLMNRGCPP